MQVWSFWLSVADRVLISISVPWPNDPLYLIAKPWWYIFKYCFTFPEKSKVLTSTQSQYDTDVQ